MLRLCMFISAFAVILSSADPVAGERFDDSYFWPLKSSRNLSSGFGDSRPGRFHMGIDLRTGGKEGVRVYAPEDGYVWRIKTSYRGYGKALYIKGNSGRIYVFFHLQKYNWDIGTFLRQRQIETRRYYQDIDPGAGRLPVKRGDFIARTGQTGIGAPHLHFEVRDSGGRPTNPLYYKIDYADSRSPEFEAVWLAYLDDGSLFSDGQRERLLSPMYDRNKNLYLVADTAVITGRFAVKAAISDYVGPGSFTLGPSLIRMYVDDVLYHEVDYDRLDYSEDRYSVLDRDFDPDKDGYKRVYNLFRKPGNELSIYGSEIAGDGSFSDTADGLHILRIEASDPSGRISRFECTFYYTPGEDILVPLNRADLTDSVLTLYLNDADSRRQFDSVAMSLSGDDPDRDTVLVTLYPEIEIDGSAVRMRGDFLISGNYRVSFIRDGIALPPYYLSIGSVTPNGDNAVTDVDGKIIDDGILLTAIARHNGVNWLAGEVTTDRGRKRFFYRKTGGRKFSYFHRPHDDVRFVYHVVTRGPVGFRPDTLALDIHRVPAGTDAEAELMPGCRLAFHDDGLFDDALLHIRDTVMAPPRTGYFVHGPFILGPDGYSFADWADLQTTIMNEAVDPSKVGLYVYDEEDEEWNWAGGVFDSATRILHSDLGGAGILAVMADTAAPVITALNIDEFARVKISRPEIRFNLDDELSGIENDLNFDVSIDGKWIVPEYDPERKRFVGKPHWRLVGGRHRLRIVVHDRCGNRASVEREFLVGAETGPR